MVKKLCCSCGRPRTLEINPYLLRKEGDTGEKVCHPSAIDVSKRRVGGGAEAGGTGETQPLSQDEPCSHTD